MHAQCCRPILAAAAPEKQSQQQGGGLRRRAQQAPEAVIEGLEDPFYGKATDLEGQLPSPDDDEGSGVAASLGGAMLASGFGLDWAGVARDVSNVEEVEVEATVDKSLLSRASETLTANSHWPFCAWDATTYVFMYMYDFEACTYRQKEYGVNRWSDKGWTIDTVGPKLTDPNYPPSPTVTCQHHRSIDLTAMDLNSRSSHLHLHQGCKHLHAPAAGP